VRLGHGTRRAHEIVRSAAPMLTEDAPLAPLVQAVAAVAREGRLL